MVCGELKLNPSLGFWSNGRLANDRHQASPQLLRARFRSANRLVLVRLLKRDATRVLLLNGLEKLVELHGPRRYHVERRPGCLDDGDEIVVVRRVQVVQLVVHALNVPDEEDSAL